MRWPKRILPALAVMVALLVPLGSAVAQCAMCRTALANSPEGQRMASGFNQGILFLLGAPFLVVGVMAFLILKAQPGMLFWRVTGRGYPQPERPQWYHRGYFWGRTPRKMLQSSSVVKKTPNHGRIPK